MLNILIEESVPHVKTQYTEEQKQVILQAYVQEGKSLKACGQLVGTGPDPVRKFLVGQGIEIRGYRKAVNREKPKDKEYFSRERENGNMAWLLGFLASDGSISAKNNSIKISLSAKDREILERIREELQLTGSQVNSYITANGFDVVELYWTCAQHKKDLARYGIIPQKTFKLKPPYELDDSLYLDYIRGYFDGNGSISLHQNRLILSICSTTKEILEFVLGVFETYGIPRVTIHEDRRGKNVNYCTNAAKKIYDLLYTTDSTLFLQRKKDRFDELIALKK